MLSYANLTQVQLLTRTPTASVAHASSAHVRVRLDPSPPLDLLLAPVVGCLHAAAVAAADSLLGLATAELPAPDPAAAAAVALGAATCCPSNWDLASQAAAAAMNYSSCSDQPPAAGAVAATLR